MSDKKYNLPAALMRYACRGLARICFSKKHEMSKSVAAMVTTLQTIEIQSDISHI
jgi:hypothetical protein